MRLGYWAAAVLLLGGCADIPPARYGVDDLSFRGVEVMDDEALAACLATVERGYFGFSLGTNGAPECGVPPFDGGRANVELWRWGWTEWPLYDDAIFERDVQRVERWYRARGYYDAHVVAVQMDPPSAQETDRIPASGDAPCERVDDDEGCELQLEITVSEGLPTIVQRVHVLGTDDLPRAVLAELATVTRLEVGQTFDEAFYDQSKEAMLQVLREAGYAHAEVSGEVEIDRTDRQANVRFSVVPGPPCEFGEVTVEVIGDDDEDIPIDAIEAASLIEAGEPYRQSAVDDTPRSIHALGAFSSVEVTPEIPEDGSSVIPVRISVTPGRLTRFGVGGGVQSGNFNFQGVSEDTINVPQWDVHLIAFYEDRNLFGGLRRFRIEERPRLIFAKEFPGGIGTPRLGNDLRIEFRQPAFIEPRTTAVMSARWDLGPDPFRARFFRSDIDARLFGLERSFFEGRLFTSGGLHMNLFDLDEQSVAKNVIAPSDYNVFFLEQYARLDLRDDPARPRLGAFFSSGIHEAGFFLPSSWDYIRVTPEARGYVPLPFGMVLAGRFALAALFVLDADRALDEVSQDLGPERYRLRGGGASSNRGYLPGQLGDSFQGGIRRWEASLELRFPLTVDFGITAFLDMGDVSESARIRWEYLHTSAGLGLRYQTVLGPVRLDVAGQVPGARILGKPDELERVRSEVNFFGLFRFPGAVHITIGEAF